MSSTIEVKAPPSEMLGIAFVLSLAGGILMIVGVPFSLVGIGSMMSMGVMPGMSGMMGSYQWMMSSSMVMMSWFFVLILISGATVLLGAIMLYARPEQRRSWGILVIVFSAIGTLGMSVFSLGAILGIVGGILAVS